MTKNPDIHVIKTESLYHYALCVAIRHSVFVGEQQCPVAEEYDALEDSCRHYVAFIGGEAVGTARWRPYHGNAKIERVAVLKQARGSGVARALMEKLMRDIEGDSGEDSGNNFDDDSGVFAAMVLSAQDHAIPFYGRLGFVAERDGYLEAGIPHHMMRKIIEN